MPTETTPGIAFPVSPVSIASELLPEVPRDQAIEQLLSPITSREEQLRMHLESLNCFPLSEAIASAHRARLEGQLADLLNVKRQSSGKLGPLCCRCEYLVKDVMMHPVLAMLYLAFHEHRPICLSPDTIWLLICQGVGRHIEANAERFRSRLVRHEGKLEIRVRRDWFVPDFTKNDWGHAIEEIVAVVHSHLGPMSGLFEPRFSTTTQADVLAAGIVTLSAMQNFFDYVVETRCGIPAITLEGQCSDWERLAERVELFAEFDLEWWIAELRPILRQFVMAARGDREPSFWQSIYRYHSVSGGATVTGWINTFFPYLNDDTGRPTVRNESIGSTPQDRRQLDLPLKAYPAGLSVAPYIWELFREKIPMEMLGGFVGVSQDHSTFALRAAVGWLVRRAAA